MSNLPTPTELSQAANISVSYASEILSGKRKPSAALARLIEEKAGIPRHQLRPDIFDPPAAAPDSPATALAGAEAQAPVPAAFCGEGAGGVVR